MNEKDIENKVEKNLETLRKRQKCVDYGKVTDEYKHFIESVPKYVAAVYFFLIQKSYRALF
jgi:hypothetical protein